MVLSNEFWMRITLSERLPLHITDIISEKARNTSVSALASHRSHHNSLFRSLSRSLSLSTSQVLFVHFTWATTGNEDVAGFVHFTLWWWWWYRLWHTVHPSVFILWPDNYVQCFVCTGQDVSRHLTHLLGLRMRFVVDLQEQCGWHHHE